MGLIDTIKGWLSPRKSATQSHYTTDMNSATESFSDINTQDKKVQEEESLVDKTKEFISNTADEVKEQSTHLWNEVKEKAGELNEATRDFREKMSDKAKDAIEKIDDFVDKTVEKARRLEEERLKDKDKDGFADKPIDFGKTTSENKEDFFTKAEQWLEKNDAVDDKTVRTTDDLKDSNNKVIHPLELPKDTD